MTEKLYYKDSYMRSFSARVVSCEKNGDGYDVVLDKTAFFPEEGGQYSDRGHIDGVRVERVTERNGVIYHLCDSPIEGGREVSCAIDFDERFEKMQIHTAEHILSGIIHERYGLDNVGFHLGLDEVTMDISKPLTAEDLSEVEALANEIVYKNIEVKAFFPTEEELKSLEYRSKLDIKEGLRIVTVGKYDACACCAPHVRSTAEIGIIKILDFTGLRGGIRIRISAGRRAMRRLCEYYSSVQKISAMLSVPKEEIADGVQRLLGECESAKSSFARYRIATVEREAMKMPPAKENRVVLLDEAEREDMIAFSNIAVKGVGGILVVLSGKDGDYKYIISSECVDLRAKAPEINKSLLGRGGGKSNMIQGAFSADLESIKEYFGA